MSTPAKVFVGSLPRCKPEELRRLFSNYGSVVECDVMNRCAFVHLETTDMAEAAIAALNGIVFKGQAIVVEAGRPKYGPGNGGRGPPASGDNQGRRPPEGQSGGPNKRSTEASGNSFKRNFRDETGRGGRFSKDEADARGPNTNNKFGPMRNEPNYRQQRSAPYSKGPPQNIEAGSQAPGFRNKFAGGGNTGKFGGGGANEGNRFGNSRWDNNGGPQAGKRNFRNSPTSGFGAGGSSSSSNDFRAGSSGSGGGGSLNHRGGAGSNVRQDRRGFALPVEHQHQQMSFGRFGNGPMNSNSRGDAGANGGNPQGGRGFFNGGGGFNARRGSSGAASNEHNSQQGGGGPNKRGGGGGGGGLGKGHNQNGFNAYHTDFPPLGSQRNRYSGPRPGPNMGGNRRF
ncbi:uncharacterized PE-PGRS family protein PE_PGRS20 [Drosophila kikkawai]|uniref:Uncharacterized PE-PGRS family protein PE_PGRS20 n=1 Tax=Drosophila kikkawai TaxID=30033 RepID=A0A6P4IC90_DROKI|nr:RNA-binding protein cabeza [Drosophila kikkawai]